LLEPTDYWQRIARHIQDNLVDLLNNLEHGRLHTTVRRIHGAQLRILTIEPELWSSRIQRVIDGHGDLRPEHICLLPEPVVFDCVEFSDELRQLDIVDELSFLAMECDKLDAGWVGQEVLQTYCLAANDNPPVRLVSFFKSYRACVRAKVCLLKGVGKTTDERRAALRESECYLSLADRYARDLGPPLLLVVCGLMGSGKSTLAAELGKQFAANVFSTDQIRHELLGSSATPTDYGAAHYTADMRSKVYAEIFKRADKQLSQNISIVLDGTFLSARWRSEAVTLANRRGASLRFVRCTCPDDVARARVAHRLSAQQDTSEARPELLDQQRADEDPFTCDLPLITIDGTTSVCDQVSLVVNGLWHDRSNAT
jgi:predicted kinase